MMENQMENGKLNGKWGYIGVCRVDINNPA